MGRPTRTSNRTKEGGVQGKKRRQTLERKRVLVPQETHAMIRVESKGELNAKGNRHLRGGGRGGVWLRIMRIPNRRGAHGKEKKN